MRKFTLLFCFLLSVLFVSAQTPLFEEDFSNVTTSANPDANGNIAGTIDISTTNIDSVIGSTGWTGSKVYISSGMLKIGTSSIIGNIITPSINLSAGAFDLSVDLRSWTNTGGGADTGSSIDVQLDGNSIGTISYTTTMATYTITGVTGGTASSHLKFIGLVGKNRFFIDNIVVTAAAATNTVATPVITPGTSTVTVPTTISISSSTAGANIYYTTDGTTPTASSTLYTAPFQVSTTTTIKAIATATGMTDSNIATSIITFATPNNVDNIAGFVAGTLNTEYTITGPVSVAYQDPSKRNIYVTDATGWLLIYGTQTNSYSNGDVITGLKGTLSTFNSAPQMTNATVPTATSGSAVAPIVSTITNLGVADANKYVKIENVQFVRDVVYSTSATVNGTLTDSTLIRDNFRLGGSYYAETPYTILGFAAYYSNAVQIYPISIVDYISANDSHEANRPAIYSNGELLMISVENGTTADIYSTTGAKVMSATIENGSINISSLNKGIYLVRVDGKTAKFVK